MEKVKQRSPAYKYTRCVYDDIFARKNKSDPWQKIYCEKLETDKKAFRNILEENYKIRAEVIETSKRDFLERIYLEKNIKIYAPIAKISIYPEFQNNLRAIFRQDCAILFSAKTGNIFRCDFLYKEPGSLFSKTSEKLDFYRFKINKNEMDKAKKRGLWLPENITIDNSIKDQVF